MSTVWGSGRAGGGEHGRAAAGRPVPRALIAEFLTDVQQVARQREHRTMTDSTALEAAFLTPDERGSIAGRLAAER